MQVLLQEKAWCDEPIMLEWIFQQWNNCFINPPTNGSSGKILIADIQRAQQTDKLKCILKKKKTVLINVPPERTRQVQPLDVVFNKPFIDENLVNYTEWKIAASQRRWVYHHKVGWCSLVRNVKEKKHDKPKL